MVTWPDVVATAVNIQLGRSKVVRRAYGIDEIALVPGGRTVDPEITDTSWSLGGFKREIPIIASDIGGSKETIVKDKTGFLFRANDSNDLSNKLTQIFELY